MKQQEGLERIKNNPQSLRDIDPSNQTEEMCLEAVKQHGWLIYHVGKQTEEICLEAVKKDPWVFQKCEYQTEELALIAVKGFGLNLQYVRDEFKTDKVCLEAVKQNGEALFYVGDKQTIRICAAAVTQTPNAYKYVEMKNRLPEISLIALEGDENIKHMIPGPYSADISEYLITNRKQFNLSKLDPKRLSYNLKVVLLLDYGYDLISE